MDLKICRFGIAESFTKLINFSFLKGEYPSEWKKANVSPIYKKEDRQCKVNYRPISLLPSLSKITEKFLIYIGFLNRFQSGFRPGHSTVYQLTFIVHQIYEALENGKEVRMVFLDISKAFDKVWHKGLLTRVCFIN